ncbi:MAG: GTP-binding protein, partial [Holophagaceae bacterium]
AHRATSLALTNALAHLQDRSFDLIIVETAGIGQSDSEITDLVDVSLYVMTPEFGAASQLEKIDMLDFADVVVINKSDKRGSLDALRDVKKQVQRGRKAFSESLESMPVFSTTASLFNDPGTDHLYAHLIEVLKNKTQQDWLSTFQPRAKEGAQFQMIPSDRNRYLGEIAECVQSYKAWAR